MQMQCPSMHGNTRCMLMQGHAGWHTSGAWLEWLADKERKAQYKMDPCPSTVVMGDITIQCEFPAKHRIAHRGGGMIWVSPNPLPDPRAYRSWFDAEDDKEDHEGPDVTDAAATGSAAGFTERSVQDGVSTGTTAEPPIEPHG